MRRILVLALLAALTACSLLKPATVPTASPLPASPLILSTLEEGLCVPTQAHEPPYPASFEEYPQEVLSYLNNGGELNVLNTKDSYANVGDLTGDGKNDVLVAVTSAEAETIPALGTLLIYNCLGGQYVLAFDLTPDSAYYGAPTIHFVQDMNADGKAEAVVSTSTCGASTCFEQEQILAWNGTAYENVLDGASDDLPYPDVKMRDAGDGKYALEVTGTGFGSVGAGPYRVRTRTWSYDPASSRWMVSGEALEPPRYRIHALHDADAAFRAGDYETAIALYQRVINDQALLDWVDPPLEQADLGAYARFKLIVLYTQSGQPAELERYFDELKAGPAVGNWQDYTDMADSYLQGAAISSQGCPAARDYTETHADQILTPLGSTAFGYANPDYTPEDVCP
jgi:hypothetical protein